MGRWADGPIGRWADGPMGRWAASQPVNQPVNQPISEAENLFLKLVLVVGENRPDQLLTLLSLLRFREMWQSH